MLKIVGTAGLGIGALSTTVAADNFDGCDELGDFIESSSVDFNNGYGTETIQISPSIDNVRFNTSIHHSQDVDGLYLYNPFEEDRSDGEDSGFGPDPDVTTRTNFPGSEFRIEMSVEDNDFDGSISFNLFECNETH
ncbi:hypothetical protein [Halostagnicola sp. A56]|uniref:hypothetical protein n=1 Tax=Halostagnicola sp. A56 TaxID=1495067 RepID=UPI0012E251E9|nr:hypothetical protein [Halostagnicola sp. A56]